MDLSGWLLGPGEAFFGSVLVLCVGVGCCWCVVSAAWASPSLVV